MCIETAFVQPRKANKQLDNKPKEQDARTLLRSATGKRKQGQQLLDEEDMVDEREMRRAQNRIKRRDYENLLEDGTSLGQIYQ